MITALSSPRAACRSAPTRAPTSSASTSASPGTASRSTTRAWPRCSTDLAGCRAGRRRSPPSYFEILTAAAFRWFADVAVDVAVVEVGLLRPVRRHQRRRRHRSRWSPTSGLDHTDFAGDWRAGDRRREGRHRQAGLRRSCSARPIPACARSSSARAPARGRGCATSDFGCEREPAGGRRPPARPAHARAASYEEVFLPLHGAHQGDNAAVALAAAEAFFGRPLDERRRRRGFAAVDAARAGSRSSAASRSSCSTAPTTPTARPPSRRTLAEDFAVGGRRILVVGMLRPADPAAMLEALDAPAAPTLVVAAAAVAPGRAGRRRGRRGRGARRRGRWSSPTSARAVDRALEPSPAPTTPSSSPARSTSSARREIAPPARWLAFAAPMNRTFVMCKPDAVERGLVGEIVARLERKGLRLVAAELRTVDEALAEQHYAEHAEKPFFGELVASSPGRRCSPWWSRGRPTTRGSSSARHRRHQGRGRRSRARSAATSPRPPTENLVHGSATAPSRRPREIGLLFPEPGA